MLELFSKQQISNKSFAYFHTDYTVQQVAGRRARILQAVLWFWKTWPVTSDGELSPITTLGGSRPL